MQYNFSHQSPVTSTGSITSRIYINTTLVDSLHRKVILNLNYIALSRLLHLYYLTSKRLSKLAIVLIPLLLLPYSVTTQALSATTAEVIHGGEPYLSFDNGVTKFRTAEGLLDITLSDGTHITPATNTSTPVNPIQLPEENQSFTDIAMLVPTTTNSIDLNALIGAPNNYWGDDDGDGQGTNGITITGNLSVSITDRMNQTVSRSTILTLCKAPYKVVLTSTNSSLTTQYGVPNSSNFTGTTVTYYISPKDEPTICFARPNLKYGSNDVPNWSGYNFAGPATIWNPIKGFLTQSIDSSSYSRNFPSTGANNLYFDLLAGGVDAATLTWPAVTQGGITATMTVHPPKDSNFNPDGESSLRVTLTGPVLQDHSPNRVTAPSLPQTFELVGYDSSHRAILKYGFVLKQWFVNHGNKRNGYYGQAEWCEYLDRSGGRRGGYRLSQVKDLTNAWCSGPHGDPLTKPYCPEVVSATPLSTDNHYQRNINAGLLAEWGEMYDYPAADFFSDTYFVNDGDEFHHFIVLMNRAGAIEQLSPVNHFLGVCTSP